MFRRRLLQVPQVSFRWCDFDPAAVAAPRAAHVVQGQLLHIFGAEVCKVSAPRAGEEPQLARHHDPTAKEPIIANAQFVFRGIATLFAWFREGPIVDAPPLLGRFW